MVAMLKAGVLAITASAFLLSCSPAAVHNGKPTEVVPHAVEPRWVRGTQVPESYLHDVFFVDENIGWAVGGNLLAATSDGGKTWSERRILLGREDHWNRVWFLDRDRGFLVGGLTGPESLPPRIISTDDGGKTWIDRTPEGMKDEHGRAFDGIQFLSPTEGFIFGLQLLATKDAGKSWAAVGTEQWVSGKRCTFSSPQIGWFLRDENLWKSTDGGANWKPTSLWDALSEDERIHGRLDSVRFVTDLVGWVITGDGGILQTVDGGAAWKALGKIKPWGVQGVLFTDLTNGWAISHNSGRSFILRTNDSGLTWKNSLETGPGLTRLFFLRQDIGWAVGNGKVLRYGGHP